MDLWAFTSNNKRSSLGAPLQPIASTIFMKLVAFDGDDTLWTPLNIVNLSDRTPTDVVGWPHYNFKPSPQDPLIAQRDDGPLFALRPEARGVMETLRAHGILVGVISYNHEGNVRRILDAFGILPLVDYTVGEWHTGKDKMLLKMLAQARADGHAIEPSDAMLVDDDPYHIYRGQYAALAAGFSQFGTDITDLREVLPLVGLSLDEGERQEAVT
jgi:magnesium-dependent phosphatase-1